MSDSKRTCYADLLGGIVPRAAAALNLTTAMQTTCNFCGCRSRKPYRPRDFKTNNKHYLSYHITLAMALQYNLIICRSVLPSTHDIESYVL